ncbi:MAG: FeoB-associated Cys-rich membrane protein [Treponema sp.]|nr:FeoB-associated Cys-rich membrane protein [Treponema sp.]
MGTLVVGLILLAIVAAIIAFIIKERKAGRHPSCGGDCASCGGACHCGKNTSQESVETSFVSEDKPISFTKKS